MTPQEFTYWLQGYFELTTQNNLTTAQVKVIKDHLTLTLCKVTPKYKYDTNKQFARSEETVFC